MTPTADLVIRNGRIVTPAGVVDGTLAARDGRIAAIGAAAAGMPARQCIEAGGRWVMPGGVDPHAHIEQMSGMGLMCADTFQTATRSAAMGGTTTVISFCAQAPGQPLPAAMADYAPRAASGALIDHAFHMIVADPDAGDLEADLARLIAAGHRSIKLFTTYAIKLEDAAILRVMDAARANGALVCVHAETDAILARAKAAQIAAGQTAPRAHAAAHPRMAEIEAVERMCRFAEHTGCEVMIFHVSTAEAVESLRAARARGAPVRAETCPHYLFMTEEVLDRPGGARWMCSPPQRGPADRRALWQALADGTLDLVSSDHAPFRHDASGKLAAGPDAPFHQIANGMPGLETRAPLMFDALLGGGRGGAGVTAGAEAFARLTATAPADRHGLPSKGRIAVGADADLVIWNADRRVTYGADDLHDNTGYNPWEGRTVTGWPEIVILRGQVLVENGHVLGQPGQGRWLARPAHTPTPGSGPGPGREG